MGLFDRFKKEKKEEQKKLTPAEERALATEQIRKIQEKRSAELQGIMNGPSASYLNDRRARALDGLLEDIHGKEMTDEELLRQREELLAKRREIQKQKDEERERLLAELAAITKENEDRRKQMAATEEQGKGRSK